MVQNFYVGVQVAMKFLDMPEIKSMILLTIDMINNKTDGFFDLETEHVILKHLVNDSGCTVDSGTLITHRQEDWANSYGHHLDGMIGDFCTDAR